MTGYTRLATSSASSEWPTPQWLVDQLAEEFCRPAKAFDLDVAATPANAKARYFYSAAQDGLSQPWAGRCWCNPPYGRTDAYGRDIGAWTAKAASEAASGRAHVVVCLVPCRPETRWYRAAAASASLVRIWPTRIKFGAESAPFASVVIVFGNLPGRHGVSHITCVICDRVFFPARSVGTKTCSPRCRKALSRRSANESND